MNPETPPLKGRRKTFATAYREQRNATKAAISADYSEKNASAIASRILKDPSVQAEIKKQDQDYVEKTDIKIQHIMKKAHDMALFCEAKIYEGDPRLADYLKAFNDNLGLIAKILGFGAARIELTGKDGGPIATKTTDFSQYHTAVLEKFLDAAEG